MSIQVIKPGILTTVQDLGRIGYQKYGIVVSGAMDRFAMRVANILVGNAENTPGLEMTMVGPTLKWRTDGWMAICGGNLLPKIDGIRVPLWRPIYVKQHSTLTFQSASKGTRAYLAVAGGIDVNRVMDSGSTYLRGEMGGMAGRALLARDVLKFGSKPVAVDQFQRKGSWSAFYAPPWFVSSDIMPYYDSNPVIRIMKGKEFDHFTKISQHDLLHSPFTISPQSDRMGFQLQGSSLQTKRKYTDMLSEAVTMGTIQVPPSGHPIILMADRQTTGGYRRIAQVATVDLPLLAQIKPNERFQFTEITHRQAEELYLQRERDIALLKLGVKMKRIGG